MNRRMNRTLEEISQAVFKSWFIDFDPVRTKVDGSEPEELDPEIADLFPDRFQQSDLGPIPEGWQVRSLGDVLELRYGKSFSKRRRRAGCVPVFGANGQIGWHDEKLVEGPGIIVGRKGNPGEVNWAQTSFFPIDTTFYVVPSNNAFSLYFLYHVLANQGMERLASDSAVPGLNRNLAYSDQMITPSPSLLQAFEAIVEPLFEMQHLNESDCMVLADLRDTLLPKLISGEIRVLEVEEIAGDVL